MEQDLAKSLVELIDQTIAEIEELKKSERFSATEIKLEGPGDGIAGKPSDGKLDAKKAEPFAGKETAEEESEEEKKKKEEEKAKMAKGVLDEADPGRPGDKIKKEEDEEEGEDKEEVEKKEPKEGYEFKKSEDEMNTLMKSMIDERVKPLEGKIDSILGLIKEIADSPVKAKAVSYKDVVPLAKSEEEVQPLNKAEVASKLMELRKSGTPVDTMDVVQAELGNPGTLQKIVTKYNLK